ncbi:tRNA(His) guanylyltransferase 1-like isoform X4 [Actinidia eriantha]|uniref:tRNA(His) guanylyltransferase 1-like isoform X4 n=1 Tax=Actinidia eriantha TaxID=165200 RepID=UPI002584CFFC|nr:tRNA(His) guanylyltransferase 1-like isoform X4 [Actinidia eriantha]
MANSKYEYVKSFEVEDEVMVPNLIVVRINGRDFSRFSVIHEFEKPNDEKSLNLMNSCATAVLEEYPDIVFSYGFSDEYSFVFQKDSKLYQRRASKILSLIVSFFTSVFVTKWKEYFPQMELRFPPSFQSRVISCASMEVLQAYLAWRQNNCHVRNQYNTCLWMLIRSGKTEREAREILKDTQKQEKHELLFQQFGINYKKLPSMFRQGSCVLKRGLEDIVKYKNDGTPVKRARREVIVDYSGNVASRSFWKEHSYLLYVVGNFEKDINKVKPEYVKSFQFEHKLMPFTWIVVRIDGCHFHSGIVSVFVSFFSSVYVMKWKDFFPEKELKYPPCFDGRAVCYPSTEILRDYLAWRQVDCHINNQYNTCFWMLVKSGKSKREAQDYLKGTRAQEKNELLVQQFGVDYQTLPVMFRQGSSIFWVKEVETEMHNDGPQEKFQKKVVVEHCDIIGQSFWKAHPSILDESSIQV